MSAYRLVDRDEMIYSLSQQFEAFIESRELKFPENIVSDWQTIAFNYGPKGTFIPDSHQLLLLPGNGTTSSLQALFLQLSTCPALLDVVVSSRDEVAVELLEYLDTPYTGVMVIEGNHEERLNYTSDFSYDTAVLYGSDETIQKYVDRLCPLTRKYLYGSKTSIGIHTDPDTLMRMVEHYTKDAFTYQGNGCLNTSVLYIPDEVDVKDFVIELARMRYKLFGNQFPGFQRANEEMLDLILQQDQKLDYNSGILTRYENLSDLRTGLGNGTLVVRPFSQLEEVYNEWEGSHHELSSCTYDQTPTTRDIQSLASSLGVTRVTRPGKAQFPAPSWSHDGYGPLPQMWKDVSSEF